MTGKTNYAGVDFSAGRQPVTFAVLDDDLNVVLLEKFEMVRLVERLKQTDNVFLVLNTPSTLYLQRMFLDFKKKIGQAGFKPNSKKSYQKQLLETNAQDSYQALLGRKPLSRRILEGRVQRGLILYEHGLRINDPMDFFEELTGHHILNGTFPNELLYSASELDALVAAYVAWLVVNEPGQTWVNRSNLVIPKEAERE